MLPGVLESLITIPERGTFPMQCPNMISLTRQRYLFSVSRRELGQMAEQVRQDLAPDRRTHPFAPGLRFSSKA
jgi:hypothetical protein